MFLGSLVKGRQLCAVVGDEDGEQARGLRSTRIFADEMFTAGRLEEALASFVDFGRPSRGIFRPDCAREHIDKDAACMMMPCRLSARRVADEDGREALARDIWQLLREYRFHLRTGVLIGGSRVRPGQQSAKDQGRKDNPFREYRSCAVGRQTSGKSTSPTTEPKERPMHHATTLPVPEETCIRGDCATLFVSLELSRSTWVATALAPGSRKMSKHTLVGGDGRKLLDLLARLKTRAEQRIAAPVKVVTIHEVGLDGFWIHRLLELVYARSARLKLNAMKCCCRHKGALQLRYPYAAQGHWRGVRCRALP